MLINCNIANHTIYIHLGIKYQNSDIEFKYDNTMRSRLCKRKTFMSFHLQNSIYIFPPKRIYGVTIMSACCAISILNERFIYVSLFSVRDFRS